MITQPDWFLMSTQIWPYVKGFQIKTALTFSFVILKVKENVCNRNGQFLVRAASA